MSENITFRARFPDGRSMTLSLPLTTTYRSLKATLQQRATLPHPPERVILAGPPPAPLRVSADTPLSTFLSSGDSLIVEPTTSVVADRPRVSRASKNVVARAQSMLRKRSTANGSVPNPTSKRPRIATLSDGKRKRGSASKTPVVDIVDYDDPNDVNWSADMEQPHDEDEDDDGGTGAKGKKKSGSKGKRRGPSRAARKNSNTSDVNEAIDPLDIGAAQGQLSAALVQSLTGRGDQGMGNSFRQSLQDALNDRMEEAKGEKRVAAWRSNNYRFTDVSGGFLVEFKGLEERKWEKDLDGKPCISLPKDVIKMAVTQVVSEGDGEKLKEIEMARVSPRVFWNLVKMFPHSVEDGLRKIAPDIDWGFLNVRKRKLSKKGQRNLENKKEMGWTSD